MAATHRPWANTSCLTPTSRRCSDRCCSGSSTCPSPRVSCWLVVRINGDEIVVDLAVDSAPVRPPTAITVGTSYAADELAARKLLALFDRAEARDFVDMHTLSTWMDLEHLLRLAARLDSGFDRVVLAESWRHRLSKGGEL
jgi:hypothetical protein